MAYSEAISQMIDKVDKLETLETLVATLKAELAQQPTNTQSERTLRLISANIKRMSELVCKDGTVHLAPDVLLEWSQKLLTL